MIDRTYECVVCGNRGDGSHKCSAAAENRFNRQAEGEPEPFVEGLDLLSESRLHDALEYWESSLDGSWEFEDITS